MRIEMPQEYMTDTERYILASLLLDDRSRISIEIVGKSIFFISNEDMVISAFKRPIVPSQQQE